MQLKDTHLISGSTKMNILELFDEEINKISKLDFLKVCMKYKVTNNLGDINKWLHETYGNLVAD
jgi:hypothetical protein